MPVNTGEPYYYVIRYYKPDVNNLPETLVYTERQKGKFNMAMCGSLRRRWFGMSVAAILALLMTAPMTLADQETEVKLAKQLQNPIAALISFPLQFNYDQNIGVDDEGERLTLNIQPVIPFDFSRDWNIISRTILPVIWQDDIAPGAGSQTGVGDIVQSAFFSPKAPTAGGWICGAGPVFLFPSGSDDLLTTEKWGLGPTAVAVKQQGPWTLGGLANHIWSYAGDDDRADMIGTCFFRTRQCQRRDCMSMPSKLSANTWRASLRQGHSGDLEPNPGALHLYDSIA